MSQQDHNRRLRQLIRLRDIRFDRARITMMVAQAELHKAKEIVHGYQHDIYIIDNSLKALLEQCNSNPARYAVKDQHLTTQHLQGLYARRSCKSVALEDAQESKQEAEQLFAKSVKEFARASTRRDATQEQLTSSQRTLRNWHEEQEAVELESLLQTKMSPERISA